MPIETEVKASTTSTKTHSQGLPQETLNLRPLTSVETKVDEKAKTTFSSTITSIKNKICNSATKLSSFLPSLRCGCPVPPPAPTVATSSKVANTAAQTLPATTAAAPSPLSLSAGSVPAKTKAEQVVESHYNKTIAEAPNGAAISNEIDTAMQNPGLEKPKDLIEYQINILSDKIDQALQSQDIDFDRVQALIYRLIMVLMRRSVKSDQEFITNMGLKIQVHAEKIKDQHNTWPNLVVTVVAGGVSIVGGLLGVAPMTNLFSPDMAKAMQGASQAVGTAGTGISGIGSLLKERTDGIKGFLQFEQQRMQGKESDKKEAKGSHTQSLKTAKEGLQSKDRDIHEAVSSTNQAR